MSGDYARFLAAKVARVHREGISVGSDWQTAVQNLRDLEAQISMPTLLDKELMV